MTFGNFLFDAISHFPFFKTPYLPKLAFYSKMCFYPCVCACVRAYVTLTCLVMQMSSMQIQYRLVFKGNCHFYITLCFSSSCGYYQCFFNHYIFYFILFFLPLCISGLRTNQTQRWFFRLSPLHSPSPVLFYSFNFNLNMECKIRIIHLCILTL